MRRNDEYSISRFEPQRGLARGDQWTSAGSAFTASPWQMMRRMQEDMDRMFGQFFGPGGGFGNFPAQFAQQLGQQWAPNVDISQTDREWLIEADLPGVRRDDIDIQVHNHALYLRAEMRDERQPQQPTGGWQGSQEGRTQPGGAQQSSGQQGDGQQGGQQERQWHTRERRYGLYERVLPLPDNVDEERISCEFRDGVLTVHIPKASPAGSQVRRIPIGGTSQASGGAALGAGARTGMGTGTTSGATAAPQETGAAGATNGRTSRQTAGAGAKGGEGSTTAGRASRKKA